MTHENPRILFLQVYDLMRKLPCALLLVLLAAPFKTMAYRPFASTDAAVVSKGTSEVELGIVDFSHHRGQSTVASPDIRYNYGCATNWELVLEGVLQLYDSSGGDVDLLDPEFHVKVVLVDGPLQDGDSPVSLALEVGTLLPETVSGSGFGFESVLAASFRTGKFTWHLNGGGGLDRESLNGFALWGVILERPIADQLRGAVEFNGESARGARADNSALVALLWDRGKVTYDVGLRFGLSESSPDIGFTAGLTFAF